MRTTGGQPEDTSSNKIHVHKGLESKDSKILETDTGTKETKVSFRAKKLTANQLIGELFCVAKKITFDNDLQRTSFWKRNGRVASGLSAYPLPDVALTMALLELDPKRDYQWTLETVEKKIDTARGAKDKIHYSVKSLTSDYISQLKVKFPLNDNL